MNERIKQLAEQSNLMDYMVQLYTINAPDGYRQPLDVRMSAMEKFAELIVRECLDQCYNRGMNDLQLLYAGQLKAAAYIEQHFGIEE
jgi:hypothetical protein